MLNEYTKAELWLNDYVKTHNIYELSSEDIIKLLEFKAYPQKMVMKSFNLTSKEFEKLKKEKGLKNVCLENILRNIETMLNYVISKNKEIEDENIKIIADMLIKTVVPINIAHRDFYIKKLSKIDFNIDFIKEDLTKKEVDQNYRLLKLSPAIKVLDEYINDFLNYNNQEDESEEITISIDNEIQKYHVQFTDEKYSIESKTNNKRKSNGSHHNYKQENDTKRVHGKIGEKLALEAEKIRLKNLGLEELASEVQLITIIDEETTFDGTGYDMLSYNENKERICIEVKTSFSPKDKPFYISKKELEIMQGIKEEFDCKHCLIYYLLIDDTNVKIKTINAEDFNNIKLKPILYQVEETL